MFVRADPLPAIMAEREGGRNWASMIPDVMENAFRFVRFEPFQASTYGVDDVPEVMA